MKRAAEPGRGRFPGMRTRHILPTLLLSLAIVAGCGDVKSSGGSGGGAADTPPAGPPSPPPDHIQIDHILIGVRQPMPRMDGFKRTASEAEALALDLYKKLKAGADWAAAKREFSEDPPPGGPYKLANSSRGVQPVEPDEYPRAMMAPAFGDVGFTLQVGDIGLAAFDPNKGPVPGKSPFGFHIIKRLR